MTRPSSGIELVSATPADLGIEGGQSAALAAWLAANVGGFALPFRLQRFEGGQSNPTFLLTDAVGAHYVLRKRPAGPLLASAHAVDREYRVITALAAAGLPVPRTFGLARDPAILGTDFYVMEYVAGRIFWDQSLPGLPAAERRAIFAAMGECLVALHRLDPAACGLADFGKPSRYLARQLERWIRQYRAAETEPIAEMERLMEWLARHMPQGDRTAIVHGDYKIQNLIFHASEPRVLAILDWELSTLGDPLVDFAYHVMVWRMPQSLFSGLAGADFAGSGIPTEAEYVARYAERMGVVIENWDYYIVFCLFRFAAILQGIKKRLVLGTAASRQAADYAAQVPALARLAWRTAEAAAGGR
jgi:aminoglycoside phosphotransferase (APT) family kinase protein